MQRQRLLPALCGYSPLLEAPRWPRWPRLCAGGAAALALLLAAVALVERLAGHGGGLQILPRVPLELKALWCQPAAALPQLWPASTAGPPVQVKILTYNLFWWNLFYLRKGNGGSAGHLVATTGQPQPYDVMVFQECRSIRRVMADAGLLAEYSTSQGGYELCMAFRKSAWNLLSQGQVVVAEDRPIPGQYFGKRSAQWMRLGHKGTDKILFVMNHHGPLPINTGGLCGGVATAGNILWAIHRNAVPGDTVVLLGDFNANAASQTVESIQGHLTHVFNGGVCGGIDGIFSNALGSAVVSATNLGNGGSDHDALSVVLQLGPPTGKPSVVLHLPTWAEKLSKFEVPGFPDGCKCHCDWAGAEGACKGPGDGSCCWRGCCGKLFLEGLAPVPREEPERCICDWAQRKGACVGPGDGSACRRTCCSPGGKGGCLCAWAREKGACNGTSDGSPCHEACCNAMDM